METIPKDNPFVIFADAYDEWFDTCREIFFQQLDLIRPFLDPGNGRILEVGCGSGRFSAALNIPYGIDLSLPLCKKAYHRGTGVIRGDGELLPVKTGVISQVFLITVLEFIHEPRRILNEIHRALLSGGSLIVVTLDNENKKRTDYQREGAISTFLSKAVFFSLPSLVSLLEESRYQIMEIRQTAGLLLISARKPASLEPNKR